MANRGAVGANIRQHDKAALASGMKPTALGALGRLNYTNRTKTAFDSAPQSPNPVVQRRIQSVDSDATFSAE